MFVKPKRPIDRWRGALVAIAAFAQAAIDANRCVAFIIFEIHAARINQFLGMLNLAAHRNGELIVRHTKA